MTLVYSVYIYKVNALCTPINILTEKYSHCVTMTYKNMQKKSSGWNSQISLTRGWVYKGDSVMEVTEYSISALQECARKLAIKNPPRKHY